MVEAGVDLFKVQKLLGHASLDTTKININYLTFCVFTSFLNKSLKICS
ncbi:MAG: hypothetical protein HQ569_08560 [Actinobacteria bacterium]|nr:hypothetical protein [Actinomycetota bacterium]